MLRRMRKRVPIDPRRLALRALIVERSLQMLGDDARAGRRPDSPR
jgi:hypothetical protein